jgi:hypothetical protein
MVELKPDAECKLAVASARRLDAKLEAWKADLQRREREWVANAERSAKP